MKIEEVRASFTVYLIASELSHLEGIAESLRTAGYMAASFNELTAAFSEFPSNPPHFLLFEAGETRFNLRKAIEQVSHQLPESHIFLLTPLDRRKDFVQMLDENVYDLIYTPLVSPVELLRSLDRAAERDYFMYMNERLVETVQRYESDSASGTSSGASPMEVDEKTVVRPSSDPTSGPTSLGSVDPQRSFARDLFEARTSDECLQVFLRASSVALGNCGAVFFKYVANRRVLMAHSGVALGEIELGGLGVNLNEEGSKFKSSQLRDPMTIAELTEMVREVFQTQDFFAYPLEALGEVQGVAVFLCAEPNADISQLLVDRLILTNKALGAIESERRLHVTAVKDPITELLNRPNFLVKIEQEISRSRRTNLPVAILLLAIDPYSQIVSDLGFEEANTILRVVARIVEKHSRTNDLVGRTGSDEFGILLPHTSRQGAMIKAERLRRLLASADFSKVLRAFPHITVSVGVSEYPTLVRDAEELLQAADEALFSIRRKGNTTCVAKPPDNFVPDFAVQEKEAT